MEFFRQSFFPFIALGMPSFNNSVVLSQKQSGLERVFVKKNINVKYEHLFHWYFGNKNCVVKKSTT